MTPYQTGPSQAAALRGRQSPSPYRCAPGRSRSRSRSQSRPRSRPTSPVGPRGFRSPRKGKAPQSIPKALFPDGPSVAEPLTREDVRELVNSELEVVLTIALNVIQRHFKPEPSSALKMEGKITTVRKKNGNADADADGWHLSRKELDKLRRGLVERAGDTLHRYRQPVYEFVFVGERGEVVAKEWYESRCVYLRYTESDISYESGSRAEWYDVEVEEDVERPNIGIAI
ncbi:hypothetical protein AAE478_001602 [Parahypoxylon ruwenzoriense]